MPLDLEAVQLNTASCTVKYADREFEVEYFPHVLDGPLNKKIVTASDDAELKPMDEAIKKLVKSWDLMRGKTPWGLDDKSIAELPLILKVRVCNAIVADVTAPQPASSSPDTSSPGTTTGS